MKTHLLAAGLVGLLAAVAPAQSQSASFSNLVDGYLEVAPDPALTPAGGLTVEAWVTYDETTLGTSWRWPTVVRKNQSAGQESYFLRIEAGTTANREVRFLVNTVDSGFRDVKATFPPGALLGGAHLCGTYDGAEVRLYVDGVLRGTNTATGALVDNGGTLRIGKGADGGVSSAEVWNGAIDEVRIWPFARTQAEVLASKDQEITGLPGGVLGWSLDGTGLPSSGSLAATSSGSFQWTPAAGGLTATKGFAGAAFGASTDGCLGPVTMGVGSLPDTGNGVFALVSGPFPPGSSVTAYLGLSSLSSPLNVLGVDVWVDPVTAIGLLQATSVDALGTARLDLPIVAGLPPGVVATAQFLGIGDPCGPQGITASSGLGVVTVP